jgi:hypothetical protein
MEAKHDEWLSKQDDATKAALGNRASIGQMAQIADQMDNIKAGGMLLQSAVKMTDAANQMPEGPVRDMMLENARMQQQAAIGRFNASNPDYKPAEAGQAQPADAPPAAPSAPEPNSSQPEPNVCVQPPAAEAAPVSTEAQS